MGDEPEVFRDSDGLIRLVWRNVKIVVTVDSKTARIVSMKYVDDGKPLVHSEWTKVENYPRSREVADRLYDLMMRAFS